MIRTIADFMIAPYETIEALVGLEWIRKVYFEKEQDCFPVIENEKIIGILTRQDIMRSHPNRIAADAMNGKFAYAKPDTPLWSAQEVLEKNNLTALLVGEPQELLGIITPGSIRRELAKHTDLLTGLYKTDYLYYQAMQCITSGQQLSVIFADVDNFGGINKKYGHIKGDTILKEVSALLLANIPKKTNLCRFGGDEFVLIMPCTKSAAIEFAKKLEQLVRDYSFCDNIPITLSTGVVAAERGNQDISSSQAVSYLINKASLASTLAKKTKTDGFGDKVKTG